MFGFEYEINDGEITIRWLKDNRSVTSIDIPEFIDGYPVTNISHYALDSKSLSEVNGLNINDDLCVINNKFILHMRFTYKISYQIGKEYCSYFTVHWNYRYFMDGILYDINFKAVY